MAAPTFAPNAFAHTGGLGLGMHAGLFQHMHSAWPFSGASLPNSLANNSWRPGDWLCVCGFHNYSSRSTCKKCSATMPVAGMGATAPQLPPGVSLPGSNTLPLLQAAAAPPGVVGMKRPAPDELGNDLKRIHAGGEYVPHFPNQLANLGALPGLLGSTLGLSEVANMVPQSWQSQPAPHAPGFSLVPAIVGKGAKQWRSGDWMCSGCNNHNFASRATCNRCGGMKESMSQVISVAGSGVI